MAKRASPHRLVFVLAALGVILGQAGFPARAQSDPPPAAGKSDSVDAEFWNRVKDSDDPLLLEMYIRAFPTGAFVPRAHARIKELRAGSAGGDSKPMAPAAAAKPEKPQQAATNNHYRPGEAGWLGVEIRKVTLTSEEAHATGQSSGLEIVETIRTGPADRSGLLRGDLVLAMNGAPVDDLVAFVKSIGALKPGTPISFDILRAGAPTEISVTVGGRVADVLAAAEAGSASAQAQIASAYANGSGIEKDMVLARAWHLKAAQQGIAKSQTVVGYYYANGIGGPRNDSAAVDWYRKAAAENNSAALNNLGAMYIDGRGGLPKDRASAIDLYRRAAALGNEIALGNLKNLKVPPYEVADIQRALAKLGHDPGPVDGKMGGKTRAAIREAQRRLNLTIDGKPSLELLIALRRASQPAPTTPPRVAPSAAPPPPARDFGDLDSLD